MRCPCIGRVSVLVTVCGLVACLGLLLGGCGKKRIYTDPHPPGANVPVGAKVRKSDQVPAQAPAQVPAAQGEQGDAVTLAEETEQAEQTVLHPAVQPAKSKQTSLGTDLADEPDLLSGTAGMLDDELIGFPMADGSSYDADMLVGGHRTLPLGSQVEVTNVETGKRTVVTIADRGPFDKSRVVDLSRAAMKSLGLEKQGQVKLKLVGMTREAKAGAAPAKSEALQPAPAKPVIATPKTTPVVTAPQKKTTPAGEPFYVQVGAFSDAANAQAALDSLVQQGMAGSRLVGGEAGTIVRVHAGPYADRAAAEQAVDELRAEYPASFVVSPD